MLRILLLAALMLTIAAPADAAYRPGTYGAWLGSHAMLYLDTSPAEQEAMFRATAEAGVRYLRMDFAVGQAYPRGDTDFSAVERVDRLADAYRVDVLGVITTTPWYIAQCPGGATAHLERCAPAPRRARTWRRMVSRLVRRAPHVRHWELGNEPDNPSAFIGGPAEYARWAAIAADAIRGVRPDARIAIGGFAHLNPSFIAAALHDPHHPLIDRVDVANIHIRATLEDLPAHVAAAQAVYRDLGFTGPLWVTETGYSSRPSHQWDPPFTGGPADQARWLTRGLRALVDGGADAVCVSFRDNHEFGRASPFSSEGVLRWPSARRKPAFTAVRRLAGRLRR